MRDTRPADGEDIVNIVGTVVTAAVVVICVLAWVFTLLDTRLNQIERRLPPTPTTIMVRP